MSGFFAGAARISQAAPAITVVPFTVGFWQNTDAGANRCSWSLAASASTASWRTFNVAAEMRIGNNDGTTNTNCVIAGSVVSGEWAYIVARVISATNRKLCMLKAGGGILHGSDTTSVTLPTPVKMCIGAFDSTGIANAYAGQIAEFWMADIDVQADGAQLDEALMLQLAYKGPFSVPHLQGRITEYISFRNPQVTATGASIVDGAADFYQRKASPWLVANTGTQLSDHPALYGTYVRRNQGRRLLVV
jgi:hypothetical protein